MYVSPRGRTFLPVFDERPLMNVHGIIPPMVTPARTEGDGIDVQSLEEYTDFLIDGGVHGLFPCGSTGEFSSLTREQRKTVIETVADRVDDLPVLAGCSDTCVDDTLTYVRDAREAGADAAVVVTPYYLDTDQAGLRRFFEDVAGRSPLPVFLYNIPKLTGVRLSVESVVQLAEEPNVVGLKDSTGDLTYHHRVLSAVPDSFTVLQGTSHLSLTSLDGGADGATAGAANVFPGVLTEIYEAQRSGESERAVQLMNDVVHPLIGEISTVPTAAALKHLLAVAEYDVGPPFPPLSELEERERRALEDRYDTIVNRCS